MATREEILAREPLAGAALLTATDTEVNYYQRAGEPGNAAPIIGDRRILGVYKPEYYGAIGHPAIDDTAAFQAMIDEMPERGGYIDAGGKSYKVTGLRLTKPITLDGGGCAGSRLTSAFEGTIDARGSVFYTDSLTEDCFIVQSAHCNFLNLQIRNTFTSTRPTAGCGIKFEEGAETFMFNVVVFGFYKNVNFIEGHHWNMTNVRFYDAVYCNLQIAHALNGDAGDSSIVGCQFSSGPLLSASPQAHIIINSSGGLKIAATKFNGGGDGRPLYGIEVNCNLQTSVLNVTGNSFENYVTTGVYIHGSTTYSLANIVGNEFGYGTFGVVFGNNAYRCRVSDNVFTEMSNCGVVLAAGSAHCHVGRNSHYLTKKALLIQSGALDAKFDPQDHAIDHAGGSYTTFANETVSQGNDASCPVYRESHQINAIPITTGANVMYRIQIANYSGGTIKVQASGLHSGVGGFMAKKEISWIKETSTITTATVGTDIAIGLAATDDVLSFSTATAGEIRAILTRTAGTTTGTISIEINGQVSKLTFGVLSEDG